MAESDQKERHEESEDVIKVTDRRLFTVDGELRKEVPEEDGDERQSEVQAEAPGESEAPQAEEPPQTPEPAQEQAPEDPGFEHRPVNEPEGVDFTMLINGMAQPALLFLGEIPHPSTGEPNVDLEQAKIQIDMLELLKVKCRGNLSQDEDGLLDRVLYQLRMLYVSRSSTPPDTTPGTPPGMPPQ